MPFDKPLSILPDIIWSVLDELKPLITSLPPVYRIRKFIALLAMVSSPAPVSTVTLVISCARVD